MKLKGIKSALCVGAMALTMGLTGVFASACTIETNHANARITVEFNGETYKINYTLYRNMYPVTVKHFIELVNKGFYNNTIVHNYTSSDWYCGGFGYDSESYAQDNEYLEDNDLTSTYNSYYYDASGNPLNKMSTSVYTNYTYNGSDLEVDTTSAYHTIYGEFSSNGHSVKNGQREAEYGALKMYYYSKNIEDTASSQVFVKTGSKETLLRDYKYNSATSIFAMQVSSSSSLGYTSYATFGYLKSDDDVDTYDDLLEAISDYLDDLGDDESFTESVDYVVTDDMESIADQVVSDISYSMTVEPIIIKSIKITKY